MPAGLIAVFALSEPPSERAVIGSRAVQLEVDPGAPEVEVDGRAVGCVDWLRDGAWRFDRAGIHRLRRSSGGRSAGVKVVGEGSAPETASVTLNID